MSNFNPQRIDPTRTSTLRKQFAAEVRKRYASLRRILFDTIFTQDALGIRDDPVFGSMDHLHTNTRWKFHAPADKVRAFKAWLKEQTERMTRGKTEEELWEKFSKKAYAKGTSRGYDDVRKTASKPKTKESAIGAKAAKDEFQKIIGAKPKTQKKVKLFAAKAKADLDDEIDSMRAKMTRIVTEGLLNEHPPKKIIATLVKTLEVSKSRAETIARTEIIRAHAEGQLDAMEEMGVEEVGVAVEWSTAGDERVCPKCSPLEEIILKIGEARGMIPRHPRCRCAWLPANVGEQQRKQTKAQIQKKIKASQGKDTSWGPGTAIASKRPTANYYSNLLSSLLRRIREKGAN